ncbi:MAG: MBL fold metallo-hydrolase [Alphaproteobacteria bacterium]|jgi:glyoxylase-like metal-dependent hydrolase (beta-lactamase superfamily II)|nr:MBL fold metallo-hydrolase [Alphaproteobacteria bacterium]
MRISTMLATGGLCLAACGPGEPPAQAPAPNSPPADPAPTAPESVDQVELHRLDCGTIEVSDLDIFAADGSFAGQSDTFTNSCWLVRHPDGDMIWDLGLPGILAGGGQQAQGVFTVSMDTTITEQLKARGIAIEEIELVSISHSHFDHVGQVDQVKGARWLVHEKEYDLMFPPARPETEGETGSQFAGFAGLEHETFTGEYDVFGDGSVVIFETPGHTPGHTALQVMLEDVGPVLLTGDLWHRSESREDNKVPRFNADVEGAEGEPGAVTRASMEAFEARAEELGALVVIQHEPADVDVLPEVLR